jgi:hypothetical protein
MDSWFESLASEVTLSPSSAQDLERDGFTVLPGPVDEARLREWVNLYDLAVLNAAHDDVKVGGSTTRVRDFVNREGRFDDLYLFPALLGACCRVIRKPFKLSTMHARTLRPQSVAQGLHVDFASDEQGWPMVGFIFMIDDFNPENGATCFVPGSQRAAAVPTTANVVPACGSAGSLIVFNGSVWHGHGANETDLPRRSIQGAYIRRTECSWDNLPKRMRSETLHRLSPLAKYLLAI